MIDAVTHQLGRIVSTLANVDMFECGVAVSTKVVEYYFSFTSIYVKQIRVLAPAGHVNPTVLLHFVCGILRCKLWCTEEHQRAAAG